MSKINWQKARQSKQFADACRAEKSPIFGIPPATAKQVKFIESLARQAGENPPAYIARIKGPNQTLSKRTATEAIRQLLGGPQPS